MWGTEEDEGGPELCRPGTVTQLPPINCTSRGRGEHAAQGAATKKVLRSKEEGEPSWPRPPSSLGLLPQPLLSAEAPQRVAGEGRDPTPSGEGAEAGGRGLGAARTPRAPPTYSCGGARLRRLTNRSHDDRKRRLVESDRLMLTLSFLSISTLSLTHELMSLLLWVITDGRTDLHVPRTRSRAATASSVFFALYF